MLKILSLDVSKNEKKARRVTNVFVGMLKHIFTSLRVRYTDALNVKLCLQNKKGTL